jgi:UDPglucose 6-dehydrogenase
MSLHSDRRWRVGLIGLGKLGMPVALAMSLKGHYVMGYDVDPKRMQKETFEAQEIGPNGEPSIEPMLRESNIEFGSVEQVVAHSEIIFVSVQTPHKPLYEGITRLPDTRVDFDYSYLKASLLTLSRAIESEGKPKIVVVISTVLPGTMRREVLPLLSPLVKLCYNPFFIAMGTTIQDFLNPEFVLFGVHDPEASKMAKHFYMSLHDKPFFETTIENAEAIKVFYNTFITSKICMVNTMMEICHKIPGCNVDEVTRALGLATDRIISPKYMRGGMGDGGGCHPRDNIALSWLAQNLDLSYDWFEHLMTCREKQTEFLAELVEHEAVPFEVDNVATIVICGKAFKPETNLTTGSPATLLANILHERGFEVEQWDPKVDGTPFGFTEPGVYVLATQHKEFRKLKFPAGSVVIDPFRYMPEQDGVKLIKVGIGV